MTLPGSLASACEPIDRSTVQDPAGQPEKILRDNQRRSYGTYKIHGTQKILRDTKDPAGHQKILRDAKDPAGLRRSYGTQKILRDTKRSCGTQKILRGAEDPLDTPSPPPYTADELVEI
eukprot:6491413-Amphidinium_carterae.1